MKKKKITAVVCAVLALAVVSGALIYESNVSLDIDKFTVSSPDIPSKFDSYSIVQLSDIHNADYKKFREDFFESVKSCDPDVIFITGDISLFRNNSPIHFFPIFFDSVKTSFSQSVPIALVLL